MKTKADCACFEGLMDRLLLDEEALKADELAFLEEHRDRCDDCAAEAALWDQTQLLQEAQARAASNTDAEVPRPALAHLLGRAQERQASRRRRWTAWVTAPAVATALLLGVLLLLWRSTPPPSSSAPAAGGPAVAHLGLVSGSVRVAGACVTAGRRLRPNDRLRTGAGLTVVTFNDGTRMIVEAHTELTLRTGTGTLVEFELHRGSVTFQVVPRSAEARFVVKVPWGRLEVLGTLFQVVHSATERLVLVARGRVRVTPHIGAPVVVPAGQALAKGAPLRPLSGAEREHFLHRLALAASVPTRVDAVLLVESEPAGAQVQLDRQPLGAAPLSVLVVPGDYPLHMSLDGHASLTEQLRVTAGARLTVKRSLRILAHRPPAPARAVRSGDPTPTPTPTPSLVPVPGATRPARRPATGRPTPPPTPVGMRAAAQAPPSVGTLLKEIQALRLQRKWAAVVAAYRRLRRLHPRAPEARTCLVIIGQAQLRHLGKPSAALRSFERYLRGGGTLAPEASWGRIQALRRLGRKAEERTSCRAFLKRYPTSIYAPQVKARLKASSPGSR